MKIGINGVLLYILYTKFLLNYSTTNKKCFVTLPNTTNNQTCLLDFYTSFLLLNVKQEI